MSRNTITTITLQSQAAYMFCDWTNFPIPISPPSYTQELASILVSYKLSGIGEYTSLLVQTPAPTYTPYIVSSQLSSSLPFCLGKMRFCRCSFGFLSMTGLQNITWQRSKGDLSGFFIYTVNTDLHTCLPSHQILHSYLFGKFGVNYIDCVILASPYKHLIL